MFAVGRGSEQRPPPGRDHEDTWGQSMGMGLYLGGGAEAVVEGCQYFCNSLLQQMGLALTSRPSSPKHSVRPMCLHIQATDKLKLHWLS